MAIQTTASGFGTLIIPQAAVRTNVRTPASGIGAFGVLSLIGEADQGLATSASTENIEDNFYTPSQLGNVIAKYGSGNLVDAFKAVVAASNDPLIVGSPTRIYLYKTNPSTAATSSMASIGGVYATLAAQVAGLPGNQLVWSVSAATSAVAPTTGSFSYIPVPTNSTNAKLSYRLQGGAAVTDTISANQSPATVATNASSGDFLVNGGVDRSAVAGLAGVVLTITASGSQIAAQLGGTSVFAATPVVGDLMIFPSNSLYGATGDSAFAGTGSRNLGAYIITGVSNVTSSAILTAIKMANNASASLTTPGNVQTTFSTTVTNDIQVYSALKFTDMAGRNRSSLISLTNVGVSVTASGTSTLRLNVNGAFAFAGGANAPLVGDNLYIPSGSAIAGAASANVGWYTLTTVNNVTSSAYLIASRLSNGAPVNVVSATITSSPDNDAKIVRPWIDGQRAGMELYDGSGTVSITTALFNLATTTSASFISNSVTPVITRGTDYQATMTVDRVTDGTAESYTQIGGNTALHVGYFGTTASVAISGVSMVFTVTGGSGANLSLTFSNFSNLTALAYYVNLQTGYSCSVESNAVGALPPTVLDQGTFTCCTSTVASAVPLAIKMDAYDFEQAILDSSVISETQGADGLGSLPEPTAVSAFFTGGAKNGTTGAAFNAGVDALALVNCNFVISLFSQDASADITAGLTESSSTYTISAINAYVKSHCIAMSTPKKKKNRLGMCSFKGTFANAMAQAESLASARTALTLQDIKAVALDGTIKQFQPWYGACLAGSMQSVGLYRSISRKFANCSGIVNPSGFSPKDDGQLEEALLAGLLVLENPATGGFRWVSDQTTYGTDTNFVYNSLQVMYTGDFMSVDLALAFENYAVGQAITDVSAGAALVFLQTKMGQYYANKLIAPSDGALAGYDSASVNISGPVMTVGVNVYITNAISFVLINFDISQVSQTT